MDKLVLALILVGVVAGQLVQVPVGNLDIPLLDLMVGASVLIGLYHLFVTGKWRSIVRTKIFWFFVALVAVLLLSLLVNIPNYTTGELFIAGLFWIRLLAYGLLVFIFWASGSVRLSLWGWLWAFLVVAVLGFVQLGAVPDFEIFEYLGWDPHQFRLLSTFLDPNLVGIFLSFGVGLGLVVCLADDRKRFGMGVATLIIAAAIVFTFSRSALLAAVLVLGVVALVLSKRLFIVGLGLLIILVLVSPRIQERISGIWQIDVTVKHRLESWDEGLKIVRDYPLLGVGYNTLPFSRADYIDDPARLTHRSGSGFDSSLLTITAASGILGLLGWLGFVGAALVSVWRQAFKRGSRGRAFSLLFVASTIGLLLASLFVNAWLYPPILATWFVMLGLGLKESYDLDMY